MDRPNDDPGGDRRDPKASGPDRPTDDERYRWIRANRGNTVIAEAMRTAHFDDDFDQQIDAAMQAQRDGHAVGRVPRAEHAFGRRRSDFD